MRDDAEETTARIPFLEAADVSRSKLVDYLLSESHPAGLGKARFFLGLGFRAERQELLRWALLRHAERNPVVLRQKTAFGSKYVVDGLLEGPSGRQALVRSVWFVEAGLSIVRFVTAYPAPRGNR
jgi:hypothetical protein